MRRSAIMEEFWIFQDSDYPRFLHMQELQKVLNVWIWLNNAWINCFSNGWVLDIPGQVSQGFEYDSGSKYARARNMARLWIYEFYAGIWIWLSKL